PVVTVDVDLDEHRVALRGRLREDDGDLLVHESNIVRVIGDDLFDLSLNAFVFQKIFSAGNRVLDIDVVAVNAAAFVGSPTHVVISSCWVMGERGSEDPLPRLGAQRLAGYGRQVVERAGHTGGVQRSGAGNEGGAGSHRDAESAETGLVPLGSGPLKGLSACSQLGGVGDCAGDHADRAGGIQEQTVDPGGSASLTSEAAVTRVAV